MAKEHPQRPRDRDDWRPATRLVHAGGRRSQYGETCEAIFMTSGFVYDSPAEAEARFKGEADGFVYSRYANPTLAMLEDRLAALEGAEAARTFATGMAAVAASIFAKATAGAHIVAADALFGSTLYILEELVPRFGMTATVVRATDLDAWERAVKPETQILFFETPTNPALEILDIAAIAEIGHSVGATVVVDNVFATPLHQRPFDFGADLVVYSGTKHIDGQGRALGGAVLGDAEFVQGRLHDYIKHTGPSLSPFNAWLMLKGLETLPSRVPIHIANAAAVAEFVATRPEVTRVIYPGRADHPQADLAARQMTAAGPMVSFELAGGKEAAFAFLGALDLVLISNNLGDSKSLITHPATTTHQRLTPERRAELGISDGLVRLSAGLEDAADLIADMEQALDAVAAAPPLVAAGQVG